MCMKNEVSRLKYFSYYISKEELSEDNEAHQAATKDK